MKCSLTVNGAPVEVDVEPREVLVDLLRERLGLTGAKVGCDTAQCGTCVVELDGASVKSCQVLVVQAAGSAVLTIEGVDTTTDPAPDAAAAGTGASGLTELQERLWRSHGVQCGFCTPGVVMALRELLAEDPVPSAAAVRSALAGNLCRCTGYVAIVQAVIGDAEPRTAATPA